MNSNQIQTTVETIQWLYKTTMELYEEYFTALEAAIERTPLTEQAKLIELHKLAQEASEALRHDIDVFQKAIDLDTEALNSMAEQLKIQAIYKTLQK